MKYRAEIDGLRALAVVPVILFHAGFKVFSGGFVGVDVFFVISGYLITTILIEDLENKRFSIINFYERRARRILPALFSVMLACIPFAWMWMLPRQMKDFSESVAAVSVFLSNMLFWKESGYFAAASEQKPLLHTWSLAVEEQYYLLFPIFLFLAWRFGKNRVFWMIVVIATASLVLCEWGWRNEEAANFFLAPTRAWELLAGSISAFIVQKNGVQKSNALSLIGLAAIVFSIFAYGENTHFPSLYALVPVLGVVLLVLFAEKETLAAKLLSTKAFVAIGLISYSAYLWHQPLFAYLRIKFGEDTGPLSFALTTIISLLLAYLSWRFIETPFRNKNKISARFIFILSAAGVSFFISVGVIGHKSNGFDYRLETWQKEILEWENYPIASAYRLDTCFLRREQSYKDFDDNCISNDAKILIWGDSHAAALASGWRNISAIHQLTAGGCPPVLNTDFSSRPQCLGINNYVESVISSGNYKTVVMHAYWKRYSIEQLKNLTYTVHRLEELGVESVFLIGGVPYYYPTLPSRLLLERKSIESIEYIAQSQGAVIRHDNFIKSLISSDIVTYVNSVNIFCKKERCRATFVKSGKTVPIAWDYGHLTETGATYFASKLANIIASK